MSAQVTITTTPTRAQMQRTPPLMGLERTPPRVQVRSTPTTIEGDNTALDQQTARLSPQELGRARAAAARAAALEGIGRRAAEGRQLAAIENPAPALAEIARTRIGPSNTQAPLRVDVAEPMRFQVTPGGVRIDSVPGEIRSSPTGSQRIDWIPGKVAIDVRA